MAEPQEKALAKTDLETTPREPALANLSYIRKEMTDTMQEISKIADHGAANLLLSIGGAMQLFAFLFKLKVVSALSEFSTVEFITAIIASMILLLAGAAIRVYQFNREQEAGKRIRESGIELLSKSLEVGASLAQPPGKPPRDI